MASKERERIVRGATGQVMRRKNNGWFWSEESEEMFFDVLAASCNVTAAAEAVGFCTPNLYRMRRKRPEFAARWQAALEQGYARLEMALLHAANDSLVDTDFDATRPIPRMTVDQVMNVLRAHRNTIAGQGRPGPGNRGRVRPLDEVRGSILKKVEAIRGMVEGKEGVLLPPEGESRGGDAPSGMAAQNLALSRPLPQAGGEDEGLPPAGGEKARHPLAGGDDEG